MALGVNMPERLSDVEIARYDRDGYLYPIDVLTAQEARGLRRRLEGIEESLGDKTEVVLFNKPHLVLTFLDDLIRHPAILDSVEDIIGPNIFVWSSDFFIKEPHDPGYVTWHQDLTYWGLDSDAEVTAWFAFSPSTVQSGCMRFIPGSHKLAILPHMDTFAEHNLLSRGQVVDVEVDESTAVDVVLAPGQISLHHGNLFHASQANRSDDRRIGLAVRYIATRMRQIVGECDSAMLVRGVDTDHHFDHEPRPRADLEPHSMALQTEIMERHRRVNYRGVEDLASKKLK